MASQDISLPGGNFNTGFAGQIPIKRWSFTSSRPQIDSSLAGSATRYFGQIFFGNTGFVTIHFDDEASGSTDTQRHDLTTAFETNGGFTLTAGNNSVTVLLSGADTAEPYSWTPSNSDEVTAFFNAIGTSNVAATLTLFDTPPTTPPPASTDTTRIGTSKPKYAYGSSDVNKIYLGSSLVYSSSIEQTFTLPGSAYIASGINKQWSLAAGSRILVGTAIAGNATRYIRNLLLTSAGLIRIDVVDQNNSNVLSGSGDDLSNAWESNGGITITSGNNSVTALINGADTSEPYSWTPSNSSEVTAFWRTLGSSNVSATVKLFIE